MIKTNVGTMDRVIRIVAGLVILSLFFFFPDAWWRYWTLLGIIPLATGIAATCPAYSLLGLSSCRAKGT